MQKRSSNGRTGLVFPAPYSQIASDSDNKVESLSDLVVFAEDSTVQAKVRVVHNGWVVTDSEGSEFYYADPTDALHAVAIHLEMPPVNPLAVLVADD